jgi:endo-1,4-beta-xylanase
MYILNIFKKALTDTRFTQFTGGNEVEKIEREVVRLNKCILLSIFICLFQVQAQQPIAQGSSKFLGNIADGTPASNYSNYWNQLTCENAGKWGSIQPSSQTSFNWGTVDASFNYCKSKSFIFKHHNFVWGTQQPKWIGSLSAADQKAAVQNFIKTYGARYPETPMIDVVNEPIHSQPSYKSALGGDGATGWDWVVTVFQFARQYCPNSKLLINEYSIENSIASAVQYLNIIKILQSKNLIDGIGIQAHCFSLQGTPTGTPTSTIKKCLDTLASTGLPLYASEFDITGDTTSQLRGYQTYFPVFWTHPAVKGVTLWGYTNNWKGAIIMSGGMEYPALRWLRVYVDSIAKVTAAFNTLKSETAPPRLQIAFGGGNALKVHTARTENLTVSIVDPSGRIVFRQGPRYFTAGDNTVSLPQGLIGRGLYAAVLKGDNLSVTRKFIVANGRFY